MYVTTILQWQVSQIKGQVPQLGTWGSITPNPTAQRYHCYNEDAGLPHLFSYSYGFVQTDLHGGYKVNFRVVREVKDSSVHSPLFQIKR